MKMPRVIAESIVAGGYDCPTPLDWQRQCQWMREKIAEAIQAERDARPPKGHVLTDDGVVRKVLGTLPITADGCAIGVGGLVWCGSPACKNTRPHWFSMRETDVTPQGRYEQHGYSTREAAEAAKNKEKP